MSPDKESLKENISNSGNKVDQNLSSDDLINKINISNQDKLRQSNENLYENEESIFNYDIFNIFKNDNTGKKDNYNKDEIKNENIYKKEKNENYYFNNNNELKNKQKQINLVNNSTNFSKCNNNIKTLNAFNNNNSIDNINNNIDFFNTSFTKGGRSGWICPNCNNFNYESKLYKIF